MTFPPIFRAVAAAALSGLLSTAATAAASSWSFSQSFGAGGAITGTFTGEDLNGDQLITHSASITNELLAMSVAFNGPDFSGAYSAAQITIGTEVTEFQFILGSTSMDAVLPGPPQKGSLVTVVSPLGGDPTRPDTFFLWTAGSASFGQGPVKGNVLIIDTISGGTVNVEDGNPVLITPLPAVPEPSTYLMLVSGLALLGTAARRRAKRADA